jgi:hypothetical protein
MKHDIVQCFFEGLTTIAGFTFLGVLWLVIVVLAIVFFPVTVAGYFSLRAQDQASEAYAAKMRGAASGR